MDIRRIAGAYPGRCKLVALPAPHRGIVFTVATARVKHPSVYAQTRDALAVIDANLAEAGIDKTRILSATVYVVDMTRKAEMNRAWMEWVAPGHEPQRACLGVVLEGADLVEIVAVAAL